MDMTARSHVVPHPLPRGLQKGAMPSDYGDVGCEVDACFQRTALFDYSFLLRWTVSGSRAISSVSTLCGRDFSDMPIGAIRYALTTDDAGWLQSDLTIWRTGRHSLEIMSGLATDVNLISDAIHKHDAVLTDMSDTTAVFALQGPLTGDILDTLHPDVPISTIRKFWFADTHLASIPCRVGRLGFTGLDGVEIVCEANKAQQLWDVVAALSQPAGFTAADQIRIQAGLPLFSQDFVPGVSASEVGLSHVRPMGKHSADLMDPRVRRVSFTATLRDEAHFPQPIGIAPFPPKDGTIFVTSIQRVVGHTHVLGMGYIRFDQDLDSFADPLGVFSDITAHKVW